MVDASYIYLKFWGQFSIANYADAEFASGSGRIITIRQYFPSTSNNHYTFFFDEMGPIETVNARIHYHYGSMHVHCIVQHTIR